MIQPCISAFRGREYVGMCSSWADQTPSFQIVMRESSGIAQAAY
jgi:hypothetical protein